ncbi:MAG: polysaccharide biosynthesis protein [Sphingobacteriales bacterium]|jgi:FlaA1/EpsC-like NDP-sugar epimerase
MVTQFQQFKTINILPRWIILLADLTISCLSLFIAFLIRQNFEIQQIIWSDLKLSLFLLSLINLVVFLLIKSYTGIIRFTSIQDTYRIFWVVTLANLAMAATNIASVQYNDTQLLPYSVILINALASFVALITYRILVKYVYTYLANAGVRKKNVIIYGAGITGIATKRTLDQDEQAHMQVRSFVDDDQRKTDKTIDGIKIHHTSELSKLIRNLDIEEIIIAAFSLPTSTKSDLVDFCLEHKIRITTVPPINHWINGHFSTKQIKKVKIEDLLDREPILLYNEIITNQLKGKTVLVTGAAGSIGSEIVRQVIRYEPGLIILNDQAESPLYDLELEMDELGFSRYAIWLTDIRDYAAISKLFEEHKPDYVYHAAAYKHVPMMEYNPAEAVLTNVMGTRHIANLAVDHDVRRFIMVSTDKAVNPTNVMGTSKRIAEMYVQSLYHNSTRNDNKAVKFITTRFGNVLGSNGSVIPRFKKQIEDGGPVTITHPDITRYFMTIPEACQLVLEAGSMGNGGEIFVFDMGRPIKIADLAKKMIRLSGFTPGVDIKLKFTGLRPGEKLYEELLNTSENTIPTYHDKILIAKVREVDHDEVCRQLDELIQLAMDRHKPEIILAKLQEIVPEYIPNNPVYAAKNLKSTPVIPIQKHG